MAESENAAVDTAYLGKPKDMYKDFDNSWKYRTFYGISDFVSNLFMTPVHAIQEKTAKYREKNKQYYYHRRYPQVPTIDQCEEDDLMCAWEADEQIKREKRVDLEIMFILRNRVDHCKYYYGMHTKSAAKGNCDKEMKDYEMATWNFFCKFIPHVVVGEIQTHRQIGFSRNCYMKQKHRMIWERRNNRSLITGEPLEETKGEVES